jgi:hypothetical protein
MRLIAVVALCLLTSLALPGTASAGQYSVASCQADQVMFSTRAFTDFATRGMSIRRACNPQGRGLRGLVTGNVVRRQPLRRGAVSLVAISAPPGTRFTTFRWAGTARRVDCRFALQLYADVPGRHAIPIKNVRANRKCPRKGRAQAGYYYPVHTFDVPGASRIVQRVICVGNRASKTCSARGRNFIRTYKASVDIVDNTAPTASIIANTALARGAWVSGNQALNYAATDNVGVRSAQALAGGRSAGTHQRSCALAAPAVAYSAVIPCPNGPGRIVVETSVWPEGTQRFFVATRDAAGNVGNSAALMARIDNSPPSRVDTAVEGGEAWRNRNSYAVGWANPIEPDRAPVVAAHYKLCAVGPGTCTTRVVGGLGLSRLTVQVPAQGEWSLSMWRRDAAGNESAAVASVPVTLRYDAEAPRLAFAQPSAADPTLVSVAVADNASGLAAGAIELSRQGSGTWQSLPTTAGGDRLIARVDDAALPAGTYIVRARARDRAGNESSTSQLLTLTLPIRAATTMQAGVTQTKMIWRTVRRDGKRRRVRRPVTIRRPSARVQLGQRIAIRGRLANNRGHGVGGATIQVFSRSTINAETLAAVVRSDAQGRFAYTATGTMSRTLRFVFGGSPLLLPAQREVRLRVPAASSLRVDRRRVLNGQAVRFSGKVRSVPIPPTGKLVELQVRLSDRWQTFRTRRTDAAGRWSVPYRFRRTVGVQRYRFRLRLPPEAAYPFTAGTSRSIVVRVRGR